MKEVIEIFKQIQGTTSIKEKELIISQNKGNELFKECVYFLLSGSIVTGISNKKLNKNLIDCSHVNVTATWVDCMNYLKLHNTGTDEDIMRMQTFIAAQDEEDKEFYEQMITKSLRLGCDAKIVNKAIPGLIPVFDVMLGTPLEKCKLEDGCYISLSQKLNGTRCSWIGNKLMTRQGKEYIGLDHIKNDLLALGLEHMFVDGELVYKNEEGLSDSEAFQKGTGIAMSKDMDKSQLKYVVFDIFPLDEFWRGASELTYKERRNNLYTLEEEIKQAGITNIEIVSLLYEGTDHNQIWEWLDYAEANDWEGCMINLDTPYECKRTKNLMKVKKFFDCDLSCISIEEGTGRNKGTLGAIICNYKGNTINIGSGFSDADRTMIWGNPDSVIGKIVTVKYKEETHNKNGGVSLQFPVFVCIREDKVEESYN